jgi:WD40 repeat protein
MSEPKREHEKLKVFISYSRSDLGFADQLVKGLELCGFAPTIDRTELKSGDAFRQQLITSIREAGTVVFVLSQESIASTDCAWEVDQAARLNKRILPVVCKPLGDGHPPAHLQAIQYTYFYPEPKFPSTGFGDGLVKLTSALNVDLDWVREHTRLQQQATYWVAGNRPPDRLLMGADIARAKDWLARRPSEAPAPTDLHLEFINVSEQDELHRVSTDRKRLADMAAAQDRERKALVAEKAAVEQAASEQRARLRLRNGAIAGLAMVAALAGWEWWRAEAAKRTAVASQLTAEVAKGTAITAQRAAEAATVQADQQRQLAVNAQQGLLATAADQAIKSGDATTGALIALEAMSAAQSGQEQSMASELRLSLYQAIHNIRERLLIPLAGQAEFSPDGRRIVTTHNGKVARVFDVESGREIATLPGHAGAVAVTHFSPDNKFILTGSADNTVRLWDAEKFEPAGPPMAHDKPVRHAVFDPTGRVIATATDRVVFVWDRATGRLVSQLKGHKDFISDLAFNPNGQRLVSASGDKTAIVWDLPSSQMLHQLNGHGEFVNSAVFSPDGRTIVTASYDHTARTWDSETGKPNLVLKGHTKVVNWAEFSPDGKTIATVSGDTTARLWNAVTAEELRVLSGHEQSISTGKFTADGRFLVTASEDKSLKLWEVATAKLLTTLIGHDGAVSSIAIDRDGARALSASWQDGTARLWDIHVTPTASLLKELRGKLKSVAFNHDGSRILIKTADDKFQLWNARTGARVPAPLLDSSVVRVAYFTGKRQHIYLAISYDNNPILDAETGEKVAVLRGAPSELNSLLWSPDGRRMLSRSDDKRKAQLWNAETGAHIATLESHNGAIENWSMARDGQRFYTRTTRAIHLHAAEDGRRLSTLTPTDNTIAAAGTALDGRRIITVYKDNSTSIWNADTGAEKSLARPFAAAPSFSSSPNGARVALWGGGTDSVALIDSETMEQVATLEARNARPNSVFFSPGNKFIAVRFSDRTVRVWTTTSPGAPLVLKHDERVMQAAFSPGDRWLATASEDRTAQLWELPSGAPGHTLKGHKGAVTGVSFSADGRWLVTRSGDKTARLWEVASGEPVASFRLPTDRSTTVLSPDGRIVAIADSDTAEANVELWPVIDSATQLANRARALVTRCLTRVQRRDFELEAQPPAWCTKENQELWPFDPAGRIAQGDKLREGSQFDRAIIEYEKARTLLRPELRSEVAPALARTHERLARQTADTIDLGVARSPAATGATPRAIEDTIPGALDTVRQALELNEPFADLFITQGYLLIGQQKWEAASLAFTTAFEQGNRGARLYLGRGVVRENLKRRDPAIEDYLEAEKQASAPGMAKYAELAKARREALRSDRPASPELSSIPDTPTPY